MADSIDYSAIPEKETLSLCRNQTVEVPPAPSLMPVEIQDALLTVLSHYSECPEDVYNTLSLKYDETMPLLKSTLANFPDNAKESYSIVFKSVFDFAYAVGRDRFVVDLPEVMDSFGPFLATLEVDDPSFCSILKTAYQLCEFMESDCTLLMIALRDKCIQAISSFESGRIYSAEVLTAMQRSCDFFYAWSSATDFEVVFSPHAEVISTALLSILESSSSSEGIALARSAAAALTSVLESVKPSGIDAMRVLWKDYWRVLKRLIKEETRKELISNYIDTVKNCVAELGKEGVTVDEMSEMGGMIKEQLQEEMRRREYQNGKQEIEILDIISLLIIKVFEIMGTPFCQAVHPAIPLVYSLIDSSTNKRWGIALSCSLFKFAPSYALQYKQGIVQLLCESLADQNPHVRLAAANGFGRMASNDDLEWKEVAIRSLDRLSQMCSHPYTRTNQYNKATEYAIITSITKILRNCGEAVIGREKYIEMLSKLLDFLQITEVTYEGIDAFEFIADLFENDNQTLLGEPHVNSPRLLAILVKAYNVHSAYNVFDPIFDPLKQRLEKILIETAEKEAIEEWAERAQLA